MTFGPGQISGQKSGPKGRGEVNFGCAKFGWNRIYGGSKKITNALIRKQKKQKNKERYIGDSQFPSRKFQTEIP